MVLFGQVVVGPPGSGKTFYCKGMQAFMTAIDRKCAIVNLDFANDKLPYQAAVDVRDLVSLERVMEEFELGPNGGLVYCMEYLHENIQWLKDRLAEVEAAGTACVLFDCPGQVELYTHHMCVKGVIDELTSGQRAVATLHVGGGEPASTSLPLDCRLCSVHLVDSFYCCEPSTFISAVLLVASSMLRLGLPHVNVLSKVDLLPLYGPLPFTLDFFTEMVDLQPLMRYLEEGSEVVPDGDIDAAYDRADDGDEYGNDDNDDDALEEKGDTHGTSMPSKVAAAAVGGRSRLQQKYRKMTSGLCDVLSDFGLISFLPMNVDDGVTVGRVLASCDKANGYSFAAAALQEQQKASSGHFKGPDSGMEHVSTPLFSLASQDLETTFARSLEVFERYER